ncbi:F-box only protein 46 [Erpetoichthys calabaricus]|uniref:F-box protein 46 n=1 Tax=Erpetoichthys calabaricus TaxID=27687 RepID=A0A8C4RDH8_ERPCA|nr:F-box only protein 46 [Erpetoichthys calabaricus]
MDPETFSHIRLWCPRPFGTYSQNKACGGGTVGGSSSGTGGGVGGSSGGVSGSTPALLKSPNDLVRRGPHNGQSEEDSASENMPPPPPSSITSSGGNQMEEGRVLLDTWYVIKPGNTKEKIAFFVAHQCSGVALARPNTMKVKGNWSTDCSKAKRRRCSSYDPSKARGANSPASKEKEAEVGETECLDSEPSDTDLLSVAEMVALVEQRTALALQSVSGLGSSHNHSGIRSSASSQSATTHGPMVFLSKEEPPVSTISSFLPAERKPRVAEAIAHFESQQQQLESALLRRAGVSPEKTSGGETGGNGSSGSSGPSGEVRIAFRVSSMDLRSQAEPGTAGRPNCMFLSCGGSSPNGGARGKEKITCDLYQLVSPSSRETLPSSNMEFLLGGAETRVDATTERPTAPASKESTGDVASAEKKSTSDRMRECVSGFHVEVVVTGAVDQCVFYGKDSTENVKEETVCFTVTSPAPDSSSFSGCEENPPPPGQLFFLHTPPTHTEEDDGRVGQMHGSLECTSVNSGGEHLETCDSPCTGPEGDPSDTSLCRLYRHVSHDFLEIRFKIQRLLEPRQYMLLLPDHIMVNIFSYLPTRSLAALKCTCHYFKVLIETYGIHATDSLWNQDPLYRDDPCKQCKKHYEKGDVSLCRWHPKPYHHDLPYGRSYWMCCRRTDKDTPGCRVGLHDNNWVQPCELVQTRARREDGR